MDLSIIIVSWNTKNLLFNCLKSVFKYTDGLNFEVIVVDNNSSDGSQEMVKRDFPKAILISNKENRGYVRANNQGIKIAKGNYIMLLNSDTLIKGNEFLKMVNYLKNKPEIGVLGPRLLNEDNSLQPSGTPLPSLKNFFFTGLKIYRLWKKNPFFEKFRDYSQIKEVGVIPGSCFLTSREVINKVGMLDENIFAFWEDADFCKRVYDNGFKILYFPEAKITHLWGKSFKQVSDFTYSLGQKSQYYYFLKHKGKLQAFIIKTTYFLKESLKLIFFLILFRKEKVKKEIKLLSEIIRL